MAADPIETVLALQSRPFSQREEVPQNLRPSTLLHIAESRAADVVPVFPTGQGILDSVLGGGLHGGMLSVIGARPGQGKTAFATMVALQNARRDPPPGTVGVFFASLDMQVSDLTDRMLGSMMRVDDRAFTRERDGYAAWRTGVVDGDLERHMPGYDYLRSRTAYNDLSLALYRPETGQPGRIDHVLAAMASSGARLGIIDYTRAIDGWNPGTDVPGRIVETLRKFVQATDTHVMLLAQLSPDAQGRRPTTKHLQDTQRLAQSPDVVILLHQPFAGRGVRNRYLEMIVAKNRRGPECLLHAHWVGQHRSIFGMTKEEMAAAPCCRKKPDVGSGDDEALFFAPSGGDR